MNRFRVALIGAGAMASRHAAAVVAAPNAHLEVVIDGDQGRADGVAKRSGARRASRLDAALTCDVAIVANATSDHHAAAMQLIEAGIPVLVEKPLAASTSEVRHLVDLANRLDRILMCGFVERFNDRLQPILDLADSSSEPIRTIRTIRVSPPPPRTHSGVIDDVLLHDLDLVLRLLGHDTVVDVTSHTDQWPPGAPWPESVRCHLTFAGGTDVHMEASRVADRRRRRICAATGSRVETVDLVDPPGNPLAAQLGHLLDLVSNGTAAARAAERNGILPAHELSERIGDQLRVGTCTP